MNIAAIEVNKEHRQSGIAESALRQLQRMLENILIIYKH